MDSFLGAKAASDFQTGSWVFQTNRSDQVLGVLAIQSWIFHLHHLKVCRKVWKVARCSWDGLHLQCCCRWRWRVPGGLHSRQKFVSSEQTWSDPTRPLSRRLALILVKIPEMFRQTSLWLYCRFTRNGSAQHPECDIWRQGSVTRLDIKFLRKSWRSRAGDKVTRGQRRGQRRGQGEEGTEEGLQDCTQTESLPALPAYISIFLLTKHIHWYSPLLGWALPPRSADSTFGPIRTLQWIKNHH